MASPERISTPRSAPRPEPTMIAVGVAKPRAHGQAMTSTAIADSVANSSGVSVGSTQGRNVAPQSRIGRRSSANSSQTRKLATAITMTPGTKTPVTRSASSWIGTFDPWASSTRRMTCDRKVSAPTRVARTWTRPSLLIVAPMTASPGPFSTGTDSPVAIDSSK